MSSYFFVIAIMPAFTAWEAIHNEKLKNETFLAVMLWIATLARVLTVRGDVTWWRYVLAERVAQHVFVIAILHAFTAWEAIHNEKLKN